MRKFYSAICIISLGAFGLTQSGCTNNPPTPPAANSHDHDHDHGSEKGHDHSHDHRHGTHGGEIVVVEPGDFDVEWTHDHDTGELTVYLDVKKADSVHVLLDIAGSEPKKYELAAGTVDNSFTIKDVELISNIDASTDENSPIKPSVIIMAQGVEHKAPLKVFHH